MTNLKIFSQSSEPSSNNDCLEFSERLNAGISLEREYLKHSELRPKKSKHGYRDGDSVTDHSSISMWSGKLTTKDLNFYLLWSFGQSKAKAILLKYKYTEKDFQIPPHASMMSPKGFNNEYNIHDNEPVN